MSEEENKSLDIVSGADIELYDRAANILNQVLGSYSNAMLKEESKEKPDNKLLAQYLNMAKAISSAKHFIVEATPKEHKMIVMKYAKIFKDNEKRIKENKPLIS